MASCRRSTGAAPMLPGRLSRKLPRCSELICNSQRRVAARPPLRPLHPGTGGAPAAQSQACQSLPDWARHDGVIAGLIERILDPTAAIPGPAVPPCPGTTIRPASQPTPSWDTRPIVTCLWVTPPIESLGHAPPAAPARALLLFTPRVTPSMTCVHDVSLATKRLYTSRLKRPEAAAGQELQPPPHGESAKS
jgi:hypothetical protein